MNMADRIQNLRKAKGISQEELANQLGVSRQAVSKWEGQQSTPDLEKIIAMSDYFGVTTDYLLKGTEITSGQGEKGKEIVSQVLFLGSTALIAIGLLCGIGEWYEKQTMTAVYGAMVIQIVGVFEYFLARLLSKTKAHFYVNWLNIMGVAFMPLSMVTGCLSALVFKQGWVAPYPMGPAHTVLFLLLLILTGAASHRALKKKTK